MNVKKVYNSNTKIEVYSKRANPILLKQVIKYKPKIILDVGCSTGALGHEIKKVYDCKVYGLDISEKAISIAKQRLDKALICDIEKEEPELEIEMFDAIIFGDVLEHLFDPTDVLRMLRKFLKEDGKVIVSVPNIANITIRLSLLFGNFDYKNKGILDNTHIRFFTMKTIKTTLQSAGYKILEVDILPPNPYNNIYIYDLLYYFSKIEKSLFAQQFIIICKKKSV